MKKVILGIVIGIILIGAILNKNYVVIDSSVENVCYPEFGLVATASEAIDLCCFYLNNLLNTNWVVPDLFEAKYNRRLKAWVVKEMKNPSELTTDGNMRMVIRKKDGKVLTYSVY